MMTVTPQLRKKAIKKRVSHPFSIRETDIDFRKLVDILEQAEITKKQKIENINVKTTSKLLLHNYIVFMTLTLN